MRELVKSFTPTWLRRLFRQMLSSSRERLLGMRTPERIFTEIYTNNSWGGEAGEFNSGSGTSDRSVTDAYVDAVTKFIFENHLEGKRFVDLGCGDFRVGRRLVELCGSYIGADVVRPLIDHLNKDFGGEGLSFVQIDLVADVLPEGDVCFIRQVMQNMSNKQIARLLPKLSKYQCVIITEHHPLDLDMSQPNLDKPCGSTIRLVRNSGVYLDREPFGLESSKLELILEVPGVTNEGPHHGLMRTFAYRP